MEQPGEWEERKEKGQDRWGISSPLDAKDTTNSISYSEYFRWNFRSRLLFLFVFFVLFLFLCVCVFVFFFSKQIDSFISFRIKR